MTIQKPKTKIGKLSNSKKNFMRQLIKHYLEEGRFYVSCAVEGIMAEDVDKCVEKLVDKGILKFYFQKEGRVVLKVYDPVKEDYVTPERLREYLRREHNDET